MGEVRINVLAAGNRLTFIVNAHGAIELIESVSEPGAPSAFVGRAEDHLHLGLPMTGSGFKVTVESTTTGTQP